MKDAGLNGVVDKLGLGNGISVEHELNPLSGRLSAIKFSGVEGKTKPYDQLYTYDEVGNVKTRSWIVNDTTETETFGFDDRNRLISATYADGSVENYTFDEHGRMTFKTGVGEMSYTARLPSDDCDYTYSHCTG